MRVRVANGESGTESYPYQNDAVVKATLDSVVPKTLNWTDKQTGAPKTNNVWEWTFITEDGTIVKGLTPGTLTSRNKTRLWCEALVGPLPDGFEFDTDSLLGLSCSVKLQQRKPFTGRTGRKYFPMDVTEIQPDQSASNVF